MIWPIAQWQKHKHLIVMATWTFILILFLFSRLYKIETGLFFFNDMGRDFSELREWWVTSKPPLLGPQNSALPFNQPNIYFIWLMPMYILTQFSPWSSVYTLVATYSLIWIVASWWWWHAKNQQQSVWWESAALTIGWLVTIHPQHVWQNRFVWNPSFVAPLLAVSLGALVHLRQRWSGRTLALTAGTLSLAVSFTYALAPVWLTIMVLAIWWWRSNKWLIGKFWLANAIALGFWHLPTLFFEIKYKFQLTKAILAGVVTSQSGVTLTNKWHDLLLHVLHITHIGLGSLVIFIISGGLLATWWWYRTHQKTSIKKVAFNTIGLVGIGTILLTLTIPIAVHSHYVFGLTTILFWLISTAERRISIALCFLLTTWWLQPTFVHSYFVPARRTVSAAQICAEQICRHPAVDSQPIFVSTESRHHVFHNGPEWRYFLAQAGCDVKFIEREPQNAQLMVVVEDDGAYEHGRTQYHELTLFGPSKIRDVINCEQQIRGIVLQK